LPPSAKWISDLPELASLTGATVVANYELANNLVGAGLLDATKTMLIPSP
jgi:hypothetical protein